MTRMPLHPASGTGIAYALKHKTIRFVKRGCTNRPFFHIVVMHTKDEQKNPPIEQLGTYDPSCNIYNERLVSFNFERIQHWIGMGAEITTPVAKLLGLAGFLPIYPTSYMTAWKRRQWMANKAKRKEEEAVSAEAK